MAKCSMIVFWSCIFTIVYHVVHHGKNTAPKYQGIFTTVHMVFFEKGLATTVLQQLVLVSVWRHSVVYNKLLLRIVCV